MEHDNIIWTRRSVFVAITAAMLIFGISFIISETATDDSPQLRVASTGNNLSALVVTNDARILILNSNDRNDARSLAGRFSRPWESEPSVVIAPATNDAAAGLLETLTRGSLSQVIVAGIPGSDAVWDSIVDYCSEHAVTIYFVVRSAIIRADPLNIYVIVENRSYRSASAVVIRSSGVNTVVPLQGIPTGIHGQLTISNLARPAISAPSVVISADGSDDRSASYKRIILGGRDIVRVVFDRDRIHVRGGKILNQESNEQS